MNEVDFQFYDDVGRLYRVKTLTEHPNAVWIHYRHPDGQWVTLRELRLDEVERFQQVSRQQMPTMMEAASSVVEGSGAAPNQYMLRELHNLRKENDRLRKVLGDIAKQPLESELDEEELEHADIEGAYEYIVKGARDAMAEGA